MLYVQQSLAPDEELIHIGQFHWLYNFRAALSIFWGVFFAILVLILPVLVDSKIQFIPFYANAEAYNYGVFGKIRSLHPGLKLFAFFVFILGILRFAQMMIVKATTEIAVTTRRLIYKHGLVSRLANEIAVNRIESYDIQQSILGRMLDFGRVRIRGTGEGTLILPPIEKPIIFRKAIERAKIIKHDEMFDQDKK